MLLILDGVGVGAGDEFDAPAVARTPALDALRAHGLARLLKAHGTAVGLPSDKDMGNSEVGHNILGAGRIFDQGAKLVDRAIDSGAIWQGVWREVVDRLRQTGGALHFIGLLSDGNVHSHEAHLYALLRRADEEGLRRVYVHILLDGRDVPETSALLYIDRLEQLLGTLGRHSDHDYRIASGGGRMVTTMDRYGADWSVVERGWHAHVHGIGRVFPSARVAVETYRAETPGVGDQFLPPFVIGNKQGTAVATIKDGDAVVCFNFRGDRVIEISQAFESDAGFAKFDRGLVPSVFYAGMMLYDGDSGIPSRYLVSPPAVQKTIGEFLARNGIPQLACAETQKFGHVTYFWNGNRSGKFDGRYEEYVEVPSDRVPFEQRPWMKSAETGDQVIAAVRGGSFRFIRANFAGGDMVGHTGNLQAAVIAVESIDLAVGRIVQAVVAARGTLVVTADHGNADDMVERDDDGQPLRGVDGKPRARTSHSLNPVPFMILDGAARSLALRQDLVAAGLANVAATIFELMGYEPPRGYEPSLLRA